MKMKKVLVSIIAATLLCGSMILSGCGGNDAPANGNTEVSDAPVIDENGQIAYQVSVKDALGNVYGSGVIVQFLQDGKQVAMQVCDENGVATKNLEPGDYTVALMFTDSGDNYRYDEADMTLSATKAKLDVTLVYSLTTEGEPLYVEGNETTAYAVGTGCTYVELTNGERNYFLFRPTEAGTYEFTLADAASGAIGYYGAPHFVQSASAAEVVDNKFTISIEAGSIGEGGGATFVIGVDALADNGIVAIERIGEPEYNVANEPWITYGTTAALAPYKLASGTKINDFDIKASSDKYNLVYNEADGFYHLDSADGPLVVVHLTTNPKYIDCYKTITDKTRVGKYFYDEAGNFIKKESYNECLMEYIANVDNELGVYPLTKDLQYIIQNHGDHQGWWNNEGTNYLFVDENGNDIAGINKDIAWLFMCGYIAN